MTSERTLQANVFEYFRFALPADALAFHVPNGDGKMTTAPGALSGVPDICIVYRGRSIFIELKTAKGAVRLNQKYVHDRITLAGGVVAVCRSIEDVEAFLSLIIPLRVRLAA